MTRKVRHLVHRTVKATVKETVRTVVTTVDGVPLVGPAVHVVPEAVHHAVQHVVQHGHAAPEPTASPTPDSPAVQHVTPVATTTRTHVEHARIVARTRHVTTRRATNVKPTTKPHSAVPARTFVDAPTVARHGSSSVAARPDRPAQHSPTAPIAPTRQSSSAPGALGNASNGQHCYAITRAGCRSVDARSWRVPPIDRPARTRSGALPENTPD